MSDAQRLGRYVLKRKIATGGMAEIWLAQQAGPAGFEKDIVIKRILRHLADDQKFVEMFLDEARIAARLQHPNIAQIFDLGEVDGDYFIAMEFIDGYDLEAIINRTVDLGIAVHPSIAARIIADSCMGLDFAHNFKDRDGTRIGLVHRDISPQNILVSKDGISKIVDFGVAKAATSANKTQTGAVKGKLSYMSPEQISGKELDGRSDVFALGITLYELVTGQRPFGHESELLAVTAIISEQPRMPTELRGGCPGAMEQVILRALEKDRDDRFESAQEMQSALEQFLAASGTLLTTRDISDYLADIFGPNPTGTIPSLAGASLPMSLPTPGEPVITQAHNIHGGSTAPQTMITGPPVAMQPPGAFGAPQPPVGMSNHVPYEPPRKGKGGVIAAIIIMLLLIGGGGFALWKFVLSDDGSGGTSAGTDRNGTGDETASGTTPGTADSPTGATPGTGDQPGTGVVAINGTGSLPGSGTGAAPGTGVAAGTGTAPGTGIAAGTGVVPGTGIAAGTGNSPGTGTPPGTGLAVGTGTPPGTGIVPPGTGVPPVATGASPGTGIAAGTGTAPGTGVVPVATGDAPGTGAVAVGTGNIPDEEEEVEEMGEIRFRYSGSRVRATVYIDGDREGTLPGDDEYEVEAGTVRVRVVGDNGQTITERVRVSPGERETITLRFRD